jgi:hypothetical protein
LDVDYYANSGEKQRCKLPFHTIPVGLFKGEVCITISFHQTEMLHFVIYTNRINIKDNFDLVLKLLLSSVFGFEIPKASQSKNKIGR